MDLNSIVLLSVVEYLKIESLHGKKFTMKNRNYNGIAFCQSGKITYTMNGKKYISDVHHAVILPKGADYDLYCNESGTFPLINFECLNDSIGSEITILPINHIREYGKIFDDFENRYKLNQTFSAKMSLLYSIFDKLQNENKNYNPLIDIEKYINDNFNIPEINNKDICKICNLSEAGLIKKFKKIYGVSPKHYIIELRLKKAEILLKSSNMNINDIAEECGFSNIYHFYKIFKTKWNCTPKEYRLSKKVL